MITISIIRKNDKIMMIMISNYILKKTLTYPGVRCYLFNISLFTYNTHVVQGFYNNCCSIE